MARVHEIENTFGVQLGTGRLQRVRVQGLREDEVEGGERGRRRIEVFARLLDPAR